ncbi:MAG: hypothetical protein JXB18_03035 [Sedimentisphaerales bacterium]|nr:hypothetical protein [Sedimentisphaerales bacterium]
MVVSVVILFAGSGCNLFGFLSSPSAFEKTIKPEFELKSHQAQKVYVWVEPTPSSRIDVKTADLLAQSVGIQLNKKAGIWKNNIIVGSSLEGQKDMLIRPEALAEKAGAGLVLYIQVESFETINHHSNKIYSGRLASRAALLDVKTGQVLWPANINGLETDIAIEMMAQGEDAMVSRLCAAASHCIVRNFYACRKTEYRVDEERSRLNEMIQQDVY